jgi:aryl-alcohol dehydrogenase-like predicted oxidoreductase
MSTNIVGTMNPDHLRENIAAVQRGPLPEDVFEEASRRLA